VPFNRPTLNDLIVRIENDITSRLSGLIPLLSRALLKILARVFAGVADGTYAHQEFISIQMIIDQAEGDFLRRWAFQWQIDIQEATFATGQARFTGVDTTLIPLGTLLVRSDGNEYLTTANGTIVSGVVDIPIESTTEGLVGNAPALTPLTLSTPILGVDDIVIIVGGGTEGGVDADSDDIIRENLLNRIKNPPMGGSENDFETVSEGVAGVDKAFVFENQAGVTVVLGSVTVVIKGVAPIEPSGTLLNDVLAALNAPNFKPMTATVFTLAIDSKTIDFTIAIIPDNTEVRANITQNLNDTINADSTPGGVILISHIRNAISTSGVNDYAITLLTVESQGILDVNSDIFFLNFEYGFLNDIVFFPLT